MDVAQVCKQESRWIPLPRLLSRLLIPLTLGVGLACTDNGSPGGPETPDGPLGASKQPVQDCDNDNFPANSQSLIPDAVVEYVEGYVEQLAGKVPSADVAAIFKRAALDTLCHTIFYKSGDEENDGRDLTFVITGDIPAMWLRDSTNQVQPYLMLLARDKVAQPSGWAELRDVLRGLINQQAEFLMMSVYSNAFCNQSLSPGNCGKMENDHTYMPSVWLNYVRENKYELDSIAAFLRISRQYYQATGDSSFADSEWLTAIGAVRNALKAQQAPSTAIYSAFFAANADSGAVACGPDCSYPSELKQHFGYPDYYWFARSDWDPTESQVAGIGFPTTPVNFPDQATLIRSNFRPSDDSTIFPYLIPANAMIAVDLAGVAKVLGAIGQTDLQQEFTSLAKMITAGILQMGVVQHPITKARVLAYEVDGYGNALFMDDANVPSLLSLPYLGFVDGTDPELVEIYKDTREQLLDPRYNPYFFRSSDGQIEGVGSPHTGMLRIWPMSIIMRALTSSDQTEKDNALQMLVAIAQAPTGSNKNVMHESVAVQDPSMLTRDWFAWANSMFGELVMCMYDSSMEQFCQHGL